MKLTSQQRRLLIEITTRGSVPIPFGARSRPHWALRDKGLVRTEMRGGSSMRTHYVSIATDAGKAEVER